MNKNTRSLQGKTIKTITKGSINCWNLNFTDGTSVSIWAEVDGQSFCYLYLDKKQSFKKIKV